MADDQFARALSFARGVQTHRKTEIKGGPDGRAPISPAGGGMMFNAAPPNLDTPGQFGADPPPPDMLMGQGPGVAPPQVVDAYNAARGQMPQRSGPGFVGPGHPVFEMMKGQIGGGMMPGGMGGTIGGMMPGGGQPPMKPPIAKPAPKGPMPTAPQFRQSQPAGQPPTTYNGRPLAPGKKG